MLMLGIRSFTVLKRDEASDSGSCSWQMDVLLRKVRVLVLISLSRLAHALRHLDLSGSTCQRQEVVAQ